MRVDLGMKGSERENGSACSFAREPFPLASMRLLHCDVERIPRDCVCPARHNLWRVEWKVVSLTLHLCPLGFVRQSRDF